MNARRALLILAATTCAAAGAAPARAQNNFAFSVTGFPISFAPTGADFQAGFVTASTAFTVDRGNSGPPHDRITTVSLRCALPCPTNAGPKPLATLGWRRGDLGTWNALSTSDVVVEQRTVVRGAQNDPWSNQVFWRFSLDLVGDTPGVTTQFDIIMTLTVTAP